MSQLTPRQTDTNNLRLELNQVRQQLAEAEAENKALTRDNKVLKRKVESMEEHSDKKKNQLEKEVNMRLKANREKYELEQKMADMQKRLRSTLERYNIDLTKSQTLEEALGASLDAMQRLSDELAEKEVLLASFKTQQQSMDKISQEKNQFKDQLITLERLWKTKEEAYNKMLQQHNALLASRQKN